MPVQQVERKLAAIFAADIAGYSRLMARDEVGTLARLKTCRVIIDGLIASHRGRIFNTAGDSVVADFASAVDAVQCAVAMQAAIAIGDAGGAADELMQFRIGVHVGDVMVDGENLLGDGVNIAARLEALAEPGTICVSAAARDQVGNKLPLAFDDLGEQQVKNIAQAIKVYRVQTVTPPAQPTAAALARPHKPSIAVLPFANMSGDPEQEYFVDGMVEEIITALSRIHWLFVIARNSTFTYKGRAVDVKHVGSELGVRYVLEGSVRKAGTRVRITAQLIDATSGTHLWADRFDGSLEDVFELQDKVASSVAGVIEPALHAAETAHSAARRTEDLTAYDLYLRAYVMQLSSSPEALRLLDQAIERDPHYGPALALAASFHAQRCIAGWTQDPEGERHRGTDLARRALQTGPDDPGIIVDAASALASFGEDIGAMMGLIDRALVLNPSFARGWNYNALLSLFAGQPQRAIEYAETALRLSPRARVGTTLGIIGTAHLVSRRFEEALPKLLLAIEEAPTFPVPYRWLASCYAHMGRLDEARDVVKRLRAITPVVVPLATQFRDPEQRELLLSGLHLAACETP